ncbi:MAG: hypothetical protein IPN94_19145 [Sphingobacteriales bacterium]|nr:hypothetical protein [Sphingobacteriales bacterium]
MKRIYNILLIAPLLCNFFMPLLLNAQNNNTCATLDPFCSTSGVSYTANYTGTGAGSGPQGQLGNNYDCLLSTPNPSWYYLQILNPGAIDILLQSTNGQDVDFILYGPYSGGTPAANLAAAQTDCGSYGQAGNPSIVDCSFSASATENVNIPSAQTGDVYILLLTNYANVFSNINATQSGGAGSTNCGILPPPPPPPTPTCPDATIPTFPSLTCNSAPITLEATFSPAATYNATLQVTWDVYSGGFLGENEIGYWANGVPPGPIDFDTANEYWGWDFFVTNYNGQITSNATTNYTFNGVNGGEEIVICDDIPDGVFPMVFTFTTPFGVQTYNVTADFDNIPAGFGCYVWTLPEVGPIGTWSGPGVVEDTPNNDNFATFNPQVAGPGTHTIVFTYTCGGNTFTETQTITVTSTNNAQFTYPDLNPCENAPVATFTPTITGTTGNPRTWTISPTSGAASINSSTGVITVNQATLTTPTVFNVTLTVGAAPCDDIMTIPITISPVQDATFTYPATTCPMASNPVPTVMPPAAPNGAFSVSGGATINLITGQLLLSSTTPGTTYTITYTPTFCGTPATQTITIALPSTTAGSNSPVCEGDTLNLTSPAGGSTYTWAGPGNYTANSQNPSRSPVTAAMAGTYNVTVTNASGCTAASNVVVTVNNAPNATTSGSISICSGNSLQLSASGGVTYNWSGPNAYIGTGATPTVSASSTAAMSGTYTVTVSNGTCTTTTSQVVNVAPTPTADAGTDQSKCSAAAAAVQIGSATVAGNTYVWSPTTGLSNPGISNPTANPSGTTIYTVTVTSGSGANTCTASDQVVVTVNTSPIADAGTDQSKCSAAAAVQIGSATVAGNTYLWSPSTGLSNANIANPTANPSGTTTYTVTVTSGSGANTCTATDQVLVTVNPSPNISTATAPSICTGQSYDLTTAVVTDANSAGGAITYHSGTPAIPANQLASTTVSPANTTSYYILSSTANCSDETSITVTVAQPNTATVTTTANVCNALGGTGGVTLNLSALITAGNTSGTWTDTNGTGVNLSNPASVNFTGVAPNTYTFTYTTPAAAPCSGQSYTVAVTVNNCSCPNVATNAPSSPLCSNAAINFNLTSLQTAGMAAGTWSVTAQPAGASASVSGTNFTAPANTPAGTYTLTYTLNAAPGAPCPASSSQDIIVNVPANAGTNGSITVCNNGVPFNLFTLLGGTPAAGGAWTSGGSPASNTFDPATQSSATFTYTVTSPTGCPDATANVVVTVNTTPTASSGAPVSVCAGQSINLTASGGTSYAWSGPNSFSANTQNPSISNATVAMTGTYTVTVTSGAGANTCSSTATQDVTVNPTPTPSSGAVVNICAGQTINLLAGGGTTYTWSGPNSYSATGGNPSITNATTGMSGTYNVTVSNGICTATTSQQVTVNALPGASTGGPITACEGQPINLSASGGTSYAWSGPNSFSANIQNPQVSTSATAAMAGTYIITVSNAAGCSSTAQQNVTINPLPNVTTGGTLSVCIGLPLNLSANGGTSYAWSGPNSFSASSQNPQVSASATTAMQGNYNVMVTDGNGCTATAQQTVTVNTPPPVSLTPFSNICQLNSPIALGNNVGTVSGNWSGNGVSTNSFNPSGLSGVVTLTFTPTAGQCLAANTTTITVDAPIVPTLSVTPTTMCATDGPITLNTTQGSSITGVWSGSGVSGSSFDPIGLSGSITLTFTANPGQCANNNTTIINVNAPTVVPLTSPSPLCSIDNSVTLNTTQSGITGSWSGTGVTGGNTFNPSGLSGAITLTFTPDAGQCRLANTTTINVTLANTINIPPFSTVCSLDPAVSLGTTQGGFSGTWNGTGVSGNSFNPSGQSGSITLQFVPNTGQCALPSVTTISVNPASAAAPASPGDQCSTGGIVPLSTDQGGLIGVWSGTGVTGGDTFNPSGLSGTITLTFTPNNGQCATLGTTTVNVNSPSNAGTNGNITVCNTASTFDLFAQLGGSPQTGGVWTDSGGLPISNTFDPATQTGGVLTYAVSGLSGCPDATATVTVTVNPTPTATPSSNSPICANSALNLTANTVAGATYTWTGPNGFTSSSEDPVVSASATAAMAGTYTVVITTGTAPNTCSSTATTSVTINPLPTLSVVDACGGGINTGSINSTAVSGLGGSLSYTINGTPDADGNQTGLANGSYVVIVTEAPSGCSTTQTASVNCNCPTIIVSGLATLCQTAGATSYTQAGGNLGGIWSIIPSNAGTIDASTGSFTPNTSYDGTVSIIYTAAGCNGNLDVTINAQTTPTFAAIPAFCSGTLAPLLPASSTNTPAITGTWLPATIDNTIGSTYTFTPDAGQCATTATLTTTVTTPTPPTFATIPAFCSGTLAPLLPASSTNTPAITGTWLPATIDNTIGSTYTFTLMQDSVRPQPH